MIILSDGTFSFEPEQRVRYIWILFCKFDPLLEKIRYWRLNCISPLTTSHNVTVLLVLNLNKGLDIYEFSFVSLIRYWRRSVIGDLTVYHHW